MSTERTKHYLRHIDEYIKLNDDDKIDYLDGAGGELMDNLWYAMTEEEQKHCTRAITASRCKQYGHDDTADDILTYDCVCGSRKPFKVK